MTKLDDRVKRLERENAGLMRSLAERDAEFAEARDYQTATSDVLQAISHSTFDLGAVLATVATSAIRLCEADHAGIYRNDDGEYRWAGGYAPTSEYMENELTIVMRPGDGSLIGRVAIEGRTVQIEDAWSDTLYPAKDDIRRAGVHTLLGVPLLRDGSPVGAIGLARKRIEPFTQRQIELVQTFADQVAIAMENARLITETQEALERQTATSEVLETISSSPGRLEPVFEAVLANAVRICGGRFGLLALCDGDGFSGVAAAGLSRELSENLSRMRHPPSGTGLHRLGETLQTVQVADCAAEPAYDAVRAANPPMVAVRTALHVPMLKEGALVGAIMIYRDQVAVFTDKETELVEGFAKQAVIAIENARLIAETQEALEQQTATAEVLGVINASPGDLTPVWDAMLERATRLCAADFGSISAREDSGMRVTATNSTTPEYEAFIRGNVLPISRGSLLGRAAVERKVVQIPDLVADPEFTLTELITLGGGRTALGVPLMREDEVIGGIMLARHRVEPFGDRQIELVRTFAEQAVIAIENARLITETREALEQQTATAEVLGVINASPGELAPVFDAILQKAMLLCEAPLGNLQTYDGELVRTVAMRGVSPEFAAHLAIPRPLLPGTNHERLVRGEPFVQLEDVRATALYQSGTVTRTATANLGGARTLISIPLRRDDECVGFFHLFRQEVRLFTEKQIALLQSFAAQAVIAMENARLITETREARDQAEGSLRDLKAAQANLIQVEKMASLGQLTAGIAHEIKNPLNFVNNFASLSNELLGELKEIAAPAIAALDADRRAELDETMAMLSGNLEKIAEHGARADGIVKSMLAHSRGGSGDRQVVDLNDLIEESLNLAYHGARAQDQSFNITLERDFDKALKPIEVVPQDITRVFLNLFGNGFYAASKRAHAANGDGGFRPVLHVATHEAGDAVEVRVRDNGTGIPPEIRDKLFQPFFTTKPTGEGTGLGLSISYDIVTQQHRGTIEVDSRPGEFTEFTIRLPRAGGPPASGITA